MNKQIGSGFGQKAPDPAGQKGQDPTGSKSSLLLCVCLIIMII